MPDLVQTNRRANLLIDQVLGLATGTVASIRKGADVTDAMAREIEWAMHRPSGWLDRGPKEPEV